MERQDPEDCYFTLDDLESIEKQIKELRFKFEDRDGGPRSRNLRIHFHVKDMITHLTKIKDNMFSTKEWRMARGSLQ